MTGPFLLVSFRFHIDQIYYDQKKAEIMLINMIYKLDIKIMLR